MSDPRRIVDQEAKRTLGVSIDANADVLAPAGIMAELQVEGAKALLRRDIRGAPRWVWPDLDLLTGPMLPGDLVIVGSLMGNGKSTLLMSQMDAFAEAKVPTLYVPLEVDPEVCRNRWAAWKLGLSSKHVLRHEWELLPKGAEDAIANALEEQKHNPFVHFATPKRITLKTLTAWCEWAKKGFGVKIVMLDHLHRMDFGTDTQNHRVSVTDVVRRLKDLARDMDMVLLASAQLNRSSDPIDAYIAPVLARLKETAAIGEEADVVLMLSRKLRRDLPDQWQSELRVGRLTENDLGEPDVMVVTCRKHRLDDTATNARVLLRVENGRIVHWRRL